ncbi:MAG: Methionine gamma-lyase [Firmicutes bacterium ADurb.Bin182]|nr:MAG: Methionine gamma-lyase [Firmicutes bacterium ADurb.Bin182]
MNEQYGILGLKKNAVDFVLRAENELSGIFRNIEEIEYHNQIKILNAFQKEKVGQRHFSPTTGYGYDDIGRDTLDRVFARSVDAEDALVRAQITSGTHALYIALSGLLSPGDTLLSVTGKPYDTMQKAIGLSGNERNSLKSIGVKYKEIDFDRNGNLDMPKIIKGISPKVKIVYVQRSRGYAWRKALSINEIGELCGLVHAEDPGIIIVVDNCYGEFTENIEPAGIGADIIAGSLIKNPGGGLAPTGGYIAGKSKLIDMIANRLNVPGIGRETGSYAASYAPFYQGLFLAPHTTAQSLKTAVLFAKVFENAGLQTLPSSDAPRSDIIQSLRFKNENSLTAFCRSIQRAAAVDSFVVPEAWDMPGYSHKVIMAAGTFVQGSSIELSADAPIKEPYTAYIQGSLTYAHGRIGAMLAVNDLIKSGEVKPDNI